MSSERSDLQPVRHESGCCWALGRRAQPCRGAKRLASSARLPLAAHSCDSNNYAGRSASICGISTHLIPFRQSQGGGVSVLLTCLCFQMSLSCCRSAVSIPPGCSVLRTAQCLHQLTATCGLAAAGGSVPTLPTRMGRGTPLTPRSPQGTPLPSGHVQRGKRERRGFTGSSCSDQRWDAASSRADNYCTDAACLRHQKCRAHSVHQICLCPVCPYTAWTADLQAAGSPCYSS